MLLCYMCIIVGANGYVGCIKLDVMDPIRTELGMFAVDPDIQGGGIGKKLISVATQHARVVNKSQRVWITVINIRHQVLAWYEKMGFKQTVHRTIQSMNQYGLL